MDDGGDDACAVPAIAAVDILHHLLAPLMLEIDVDVGRFPALRRHEAREEQFVLHQGEKIEFLPNLRGSLALVRFGRV